MSYHMNTPKTYDAVIIGAGYAGVSAAIWLGRFKRSVLLVSSGQPRNYKAHVLHGYPGFDGGNPAELLDKMRDEAAAYGICTLDAWAESISKDVTPDGDIFTIKTPVKTVTARRVLIATGVTDTKPDITGFDQFEGVSAWHCPACDGIEYSGKKLVIIGWGPEVADFAKEFLTYSSDIIVMTHGHADELNAQSRKALHDNNIPVIDTEIAELLAADGSRTQIGSLVMTDGTRLPADGIFYHINRTPRLELVQKLGCDINHGAVTGNHQQETCVPGVYVAGDIVNLEDLVVVACATGTTAASAIHNSLL